MSMSLMVKAMKAEVGNPLRKLVLIKLADNANDKGECWPSYQHIADQCEISRRSVMRHIDALIADGFVSKRSRKTPDGATTNVYALRFEVAEAEDLRGDRESPPGVTESHQGGDTVSLGGGDRESPRTSHSLEPVNEPKRTLTPSPVDWIDDETWTDFLAHRKSIKKPLSQEAQKRLIKKLERLRADGQDAVAVLDESITQGWAGVFPLKDKKPKQKQAWGDHTMVDFDDPFAGCI